MTVTPSQLADPAFSLRMFGTIVDQETGALVRYDPYSLTHQLQATILGYLSDPPRNDGGYAKWLVALKGRQSGASTVTALALYAKVAYTPGIEAVIIADNKDRADGLFDRVMTNHAHWDRSVRVEQQSTNETRSFTTKINSRVRVLSGHSDAVGIGRSVDILHASELAFWNDAGHQFSMLLPAMINRKNSLVVQECTPAPMSESSAQFWHDQCMDAMKGAGRYIFTFAPFWDGKLCTRPWPAGEQPTKDEEELLRVYGPRGLALENLAFRREVMETDPEVRRNPELFGVFYPFDPYTCWVSSGAGVIPAHAVDRFKLLMPEQEGLTIFEEPKDGHQYVIGVDPAGWGQDHQAFQILEVWADDWRQVASFGANIDPNDFGEILFNVGIKYNKAKIGVERNGVGAAPIVLLRHKKYPNLHYDGMNKPGVHKSSHDEWLTVLVEALMDKLTLYGGDTVSQVRGYRGDKMIERSPKAELLSKTTGRRRPRHHWDKVSALMVACSVAPYMPTRYRPVEKPDNVVLFQDMTWAEHQEYRAKLALIDAQRKGRKTGRRTHYIRRR